MPVRSSGIIENAVELGDDTTTDEVVDMERLLPEDVVEASMSILPSSSSHDTRPRRRLEEYFEQKRLEAWLHDPLDDHSH